MENRRGYSNFSFAKKKIIFSPQKNIICLNKILRYEFSLKVLFAVRLLNEVEIVKR